MLCKDLNGCVKRSQHCWTQHFACGWTPCWMLLQVVAWNLNASNQKRMRFQTFEPTSSNISLFRVHWSTGQQCCVRLKGTHKNVGLVHAQHTHCIARVSSNIVGTYWDRLNTITNSEQQYCWAQHCWQLLRAFLCLINLTTQYDEAKTFLIQLNIH